MRRVCAVSFVCMLGVVSSAYGQWSTDSTMHQVVADGAGEQVQPKIVPTPDGGAYVSWFTSVSGYDVRLQRLDASGNEMWAHNGVLVADRGYSSTQDYGLDVDSVGNALIVFRDDRFVGDRITAQRVSPDGSMMWGANGVQFANGSDFVAAPVVAGTSDGGCVVGWINNNDSHFVGLDATGAVSWTTVLTDPGGEVINVSDIRGADGGSVIVSWVQRDTPFFADKHLYAQKLNSDGTEAWASRVAVFDNGSLQFGNFPDFRGDGSGGAVFSWYDTANSLQVYAQHLSSSGVEQFAHNGVEVSTVAAERVSPRAIFDPGTDSVLVAWIELNNNQADQGVYAQRIDASGARQWSDGGIEVSAVDANSSGSIQTEVLDGALAVMWIENAGGFGLDRVLAHALAMDSSDVWTGGTVEVASDLGLRSRLTTALSSDGFVISGWQLGDTGVSDVQTHNLNSDGSLGNLGCPADLADPIGTLNLQDVFAYLALFNAGDPAADLADPIGTLNLQDVFAYLALFNAGCP